MIIVTGCAGFIGSNLAEELLKNNEQVIGIDCFDDYYDVGIKKKNLSELKKYKNFKFLKQDVRKINKDIIKDADVIYHQAGIGGVRYSIENPKKYFELNAAATFLLLEKCLSSNIRKFVYASSSSVYGNVPENLLPVNEERKCAPISPYGCSKLAAEEYCMNFYRAYGMPTVALRYFTVYGLRQRPDEAICKFANKILNSEPIDVYGNGQQTRDFTYVKDAVRGIILSANSKSGGEIFNIGSGQRVSLSEIIRIIEACLDKKAHLNYVNSQSGDVAHTLADISKARHILGYEPKYTIEAGIKEYIEWIQKGKRK
ncbi:ADP-L-glycero-D-manno-heptose-6-epimerase [uncultured archaeon]|nr:ADP-L-glycero-D-manno-heptose-6-epimerase [uncultured archaeon]